MVGAAWHNLKQIPVRPNRRFRNVAELARHYSLVHVVMHPVNLNVEFMFRGLRFSFALFRRSWETSFLMYGIMIPHNHGT